MAGESGGAEHSDRIKNFISFLVLVPKPLLHRVSLLPKTFCGPPSSTRRALNSVAWYQGMCSVLEIPSQLHPPLSSRPHLAPPASVGPLAFLGPLQGSEVATPAHTWAFADTLPLLKKTFNQAVPSPSSFFLSLPSFLSSNIHPAQTLCHVLGT